MSYDFLMNNYGPAVTTLVSGDGCYLYDDKGKKYLDFTSGIGVNSLGYNNKEWIEKITDQLSKVQHVSNIFYNDTTLEFSEKIVNVSGMDKVFLCNSGAEANEGAIKLARKYSFEKYGNNRNVILSLKKSFHGRTMAALTATGQDKFHNYFFPFPEGFHYVERNNIMDFKEKVNDNVCAIIMEAIQGEGGVNPLNEEFVKEVVATCKEKDILVIFDEVQCGIGRTGKLFGFNSFEVEADIITMAKGLGGGLPIAGVLCNKKLADVFKPGDHGTTYGGNPVACAGALAVLDIICKEDVYNNISENGEYIFKTIEESNLNNLVEIRGKGLMIGIETKVSSAIIKEKCAEKGLLVLTAGPNTVRLLPPLVITREDLTIGINILIDVIRGEL